LQDASNRLFLRKGAQEGFELVKGLKGLGRFGKDLLGHENEHG